jgi:hypothetical protein
MSLHVLLRYRTLVLGLVMLALLVGTAIWVFDADGAQMLRLALACLLLLGATIVAGGIGALLLVALKHWRGGR